MNISQETCNMLSELYTYTFYDEAYRETTASKATEIHIGFSIVNKEEPEYISKSIKATVKEMTLDYILNAINSQSVYKSFAKYFNNVCKAHNLSAYPTTYGIGVYALFRSDKHLSQIRTQIDTILTNLGIVYTTEYSLANWVLRYKISKAKDNIERINNIVKSV